MSPPPCRACAAPLAEGQAWCLDCGAAALTRIAPTPRGWQQVAAILALACLLAVLLIAIAIARLATGTG